MLLKRYIHTIFEHFVYIRCQKHQEFTKLSKFAKIVSVVLLKKCYLCSVFQYTSQHTQQQGHYTTAFNSSLTAVNESCNLLFN